MLILLVSWLPLPPKEQPWEVLEFFSGRGRLSSLAAKCGFSVGSFDINMLPKRLRKRSQKQRTYFRRRQPMDINGEVGFSFLSTA